jgi:release factor glutamine methyltransferase
LNRTIGQVLAEVKDNILTGPLQLSPEDIHPALTAQLLLSSVLGLSKAQLITHTEQVISKQQHQEIQELTTRFTTGEPLPYILGQWEFYGLEFIVTPDVLIPRPETEFLVEQAAEWISAKGVPPRCVDAGAGSGCIAVSLLTLHPDLIMTATDLSVAALAVADRNARRHRVSDRINLLRCHLLQPLQTRFDLVCANLPYIPTARLADLQVARHEPSSALDGGPQGMTLINELLYQAQTRLAQDGLILLEIDCEQESLALDAGRLYFSSSDVRVLQDLAGKPRLLRIQNHVR